MPALGRKGIGIKSKIPIQDIIIEEAGPVLQTSSRTNGPVEVVRDSQTGKYHLFDGQHRVREAMKRGETSIVALIAKGDPVDGGGWNISKGEFDDAGISTASYAITTSGIFKYNELIKAGKSSDVAYAQARAANNQAFTKFLKTLDWKRPKNSNPNIPDIEYMRNNPTIGDIVRQAEKARELGNRRLFILLRGEDGVRASNCKGLQSKWLRTAITNFGTGLSASIHLPRTTLCATETALTQPGLQSTALRRHYMPLDALTVLGLS